MTAAPGAVVVLWWITLILTVILIVPITLRLLHRTWIAARTIRRYAADTRASAEAIALNVAGAAALDEAIAAAGPLLERAASLPDRGVAPRPASGGGNS